MPKKKPNPEKKNSKQARSVEMSDKKASQVRGGADGSVRTMDPTNAVPGSLSNLTIKSLKAK